MVSNLVRALAVKVVVVLSTALTFVEPIEKLLRAMDPSPSEPELVEL
jgi:hypothetical protein